MIWNEACKKKWIYPDILEKKVEELKSAGKTIATLNGSFDLLHAGHLYIIYEASKVADVLIVALNSDRSIQQYKSLDRPIITLQYRLEMMSAFEFVDYVTWFDETDPRQLLSKIRPHVHVNGAEYGENCIEADCVKQYGGKLHLVPRISGEAHHTLATSEIVDKICALSGLPKTVTV
ncbi:MAG TPA: adenylyltransferase/cytidyltransferase family protein [Chlamydiales bacterium]|nr:adenylyltransferase/cytidyltransferase family protein [Chlamydiales bacterium]